jgi:hypothetical protein
MTNCCSKQSCHGRLSSGKSFLRRTPIDEEDHSTTASSFLDEDEVSSWAGTSSLLGDFDETEQDESEEMFPIREKIDLGKMHASSKTSLAVDSVLFEEEVQVREYAVTVGVSPSATDSCPVSLDWSYNEYQDCLPEEDKQSDPQRRSLDERRKRIAHVQGMTIDQVRIMEIERVLERLEEVVTIVDNVDGHDSGSNNNQNSTSSDIRPGRSSRQKDTRPARQCTGRQRHGCIFSERSSPLFASGRDWDVSDRERPSSLVTETSKKWNSTNEKETITL